MFFFEGISLAAGFREFAKLIVNTALFDLELADSDFDLVDVDWAKNELTEVRITNDSASSRVIPELRARRGNTLGLLIGDARRDERTGTGKIDVAGLDKLPEILLSPGYRVELQIQNHDD